MRRGASLHADEAGRKFGKERHQLAASQPALQYGTPRCISAVNLEDGFCQVETDGRNLFHGRLPSIGGL
jgi:hypothetical protein